jgi:hypothetical protein
MLEFLLPKSATRVLVCLTPVSMRWGVDRLRRFCREELETEPDQTTSFLFINKDRDTLLLYFVDEIGEQILTKKLEKGSFLLPVPAENGAPFVEVSPAKLPRLFRSQ